MKRHLQELQRARPATYRDSNEGLFLDRNERVVPHSRATLDALSQALANVALGLYPELDPLYRKLADWLKISPDRIYVTEGIAGAIKALLETTTNPGENVVCPTPTFALYPVFSEMFQLEHRTVGYSKNYQLDLGKLFDAIDDETAIVFLPNPNVPIAGTLGFDKVAEIATRCAEHQAVLVVDEVYYLFGGPTAISLIDDYRNVFVMRSFSKAFGLAGIRVGYLIGNSDDIDYVSKTRGGYEASSVSIEIASFFIDNFHLIAEYIQHVKEGLAYLKCELDGMKLEYNGGNDSNFLYVDFGDKQRCRRVVRELRMRNIYVRAGWPAPYSAGVSVSGAPKGIMEGFVVALSDALAHGGL